MADFQMISTLLEKNSYSYIVYAGFWMFVTVNDTLGCKKRWISFIFPVIMPLFLMFDRNIHS